MARRAAVAARTVAIASVPFEVLGAVVMAADAPRADWCAALARMWDDRAYYDRLAAAARAAAASRAFSFSRFSAAFASFSFCIISDGYRGGLDAGRAIFSIPFLHFSTETNWPNFYYFLLTFAKIY